MSGRRFDFVFILLIALTAANSASLPADEPRAGMESRVAAAVASTRTRSIGDIRYYGQLTAPYVSKTLIDSVGRLQNSQNPYYYYAVYSGQISAAYESYARSVAYTHGSEFQTRLEEYRYWRYWQAQYNFAAATYVYYGILYDAYLPPGYALAYYDAAVTFYVDAGSAGYYGLADYQLP